ncbi:MAG: hypothetical protein ACHQAV_05280 [Solirubrobacterales bacterium]
MADKPAQPKDSEETISLAGHDPEAVLKALLKVDPEAEPAEQGRGEREPCPKTNEMGQRCKHPGGKGHFGPCWYDA